MRAIAYIVAALAAIIIMVTIATSPNQSTDGPDSVEVALAQPTSASIQTEPGSIAIEVPKMHCEFSCYPRVKEALEENDAVEEVALAEQKEEGVLDKHQVIVTYKTGFNFNDAIVSLEKAGFTSSSIVQ